MSDWDRIVADLHNKHDIERAVEACEELDDAADASCLPRLYRLLKSGENFFVREAAAVPIARLEGVRALPELLQALKLGEDENHDNDGLVGVIVNMVSDNAEHAAPLLNQMLQSSSERERWDAAWLWGFAAKALAPEPLIALLCDSSPRVRSAAIGSLATFKGRENVFISLLVALKDSHEEVKISAASALGYFGDRRAVSELRKMLLSSESVRRVAAYAVKQLARSPFTGRDVPLEGN